MEEQNRPEQGISEEQPIPEESEVSEEKEVSAKQTAKTRRIAGIQHRIAGDIYTFAVEELELQRGDHVVIEGEHGDSIGIVVIPPYDEVAKNVPTNVKNVLRLASDDDLAAHYARREEAREYFDMCERKIAEHNLGMKLVDAELTEGGKKVIFFFFAEQRVDFRLLVKDLASQLHKYIEMRQIGSRDASSFIGCMGPCGRTTCCSTFLREFRSISIAMAKNQGLSPNPAKLTGMCGKLKCCLNYENKAYAELRKGLPKQNAWVETPRGVGKIFKLDILRQCCAVRLEGGGEVKLPCNECTVTQARRQDQTKQVRGQRKESKQREQRGSRKKRSSEKTSEAEQKYEAEESPENKQESGSSGDATE